MTPVLPDQALDHYTEIWRANPRLRAVALDVFLAAPHAHLAPLLAPAPADEEDVPRPLLPAQRRIQHWLDAVERFRETARRRTRSAEGESDGALALARAHPAARLAGDGYRETLRHHAWATSAERTLARTR